MKKVNIFVLFIIFFLCYLYNHFSVVEGHDHFFVFVPPPTRIISFNFVYILNVLLPKLFHYSNFVDFRAGIIGCTIISLYYLFSVWIFSQSFFLSKDNLTKSIFTFENIFIFPISFMLITKFFINFAKDNYLYFQGIRENIIYMDHVGGCPIYFLFFFALINIIVNNKEFNIIEKIFYSIIGFFLGMWTEILNLSVFFSIILIMSFICFYDKEKLKKTSIYFLLGSFFLGLFIYYFVGGKYDFNHIGSIGDYNILEKLSENFANIGLFLKKFCELYIFDKIIFYLLMLIFCVIIKVCFYSSSQFAAKEDILVKRTKITYSLIVLFCIIAGFFIACFTSIFVANYRPDAETYIFERPTFQLIGTNILGFVVLALLGVIYYNLKDNLKKIVQCILICFTIILIYIFLPDYIMNIKWRADYKLFVYNIEKSIALYTKLGESAILPANFIERNATDFLCENAFGFTNREEYLEFYNQNKIHNAYYNAKYFEGYYFYYGKLYKNPFFAIQFKDEDYASTQLEERIKLFSEITKNKKLINLPFLISFSDINKIDEADITIEYIEEKEREFNTNDILLKTKAYIYYRDKNYAEALKLYNEYLKNNLDDYDALINIGEIYKEQNNIEAAKDVYKKLVELDNYNIFFNFNLMNIYYNYDNDYEKALEINEKLINQEKGLDIRDRMTKLYLNGAIIYKALKNEEKKNEYINYAMGVDNNFIRNVNYIKSEEKTPLIGFD